MFDIPAFTEIIDVAFAASLDLDDMTLPETQILDKMAQTYIAQAGTGRVWWACVLKSPRKLTGKTVYKFIVDWESSQARDSFLSSQEFGALLATWQTSPTPFTTSPALLFPLGYRRRYVFRIPGPYHHAAVTVLLHFKFSSGYSWNTVDISPDGIVNNREYRWRSCWTSLCIKALRSRGGVVTSGSTDGWLLGSKQTFLGVFMFLDSDSAQEFLDFADYEDEGREEWGLPKLRELADKGTEIEFIKFEFEGKNPSFNG